MNKISIITVLGLAFACNGADIYPIRVNSVGFRPDSVKAATVTEACNDFVVKNAQTGEVVSSGNVSGPTHQQDIDQQGFVADFSGFSTPGKYYIEAGELGRSVEFTIAADVYRQPLITAMRGFYLWRCGCSVSGEYAGQVYSHAVCHTEDGYLDYTGLGTARHESTGGWHDAGDFGKYIVNAGFSMGVLFHAWEHFGDSLRTLELNLPPASFDCPDFLKELKWECDWMLTMQYPDGSGKVSHKLTALNFSGFIMPENDKQKRYLTDWSSAATANFAATMAMAARCFKPYNAEYADKCLKAAILSYDFLAANPQEKRFVQGPFSTGDYSSRDVDDKLWMAVELWRTTGEEKYLRDFEARSAGVNASSISDYGWGQLSTLAVVSYLLTDMPGKDMAVATKLKTELIAAADSIVTTADNDIYRRVMGNKYYWGCNGTIAGKALVLWTANKLSADKKYRRAAEDAVANLFGRNYYNRSFVTGIGANPPMHPHDRRSGADNIEQPWPGYLIGGGQKATDWQDIQDSYQTNEIAINWQATLVYALAAVDCWKE